MISLRRSAVGASRRCATDARVGAGCRLGAGVDRPSGLGASHDRSRNRLAAVRADPRLRVVGGRVDSVHRHDRSAGGAPVRDAGRHARRRCRLMARRTAAPGGGSVSMRIGGRATACPISRAPTRRGCWRRTGGSAPCSGSCRDAGRYPRERQMLAGFSQGGDHRRRRRVHDRRADRGVGADVDDVCATRTRGGPGCRGGAACRVFISHGRRDSILPFDAAVRLQQAMRDAGLQRHVGPVRRRPRDAGRGGHGAERLPGAALTRLPEGRARNAQP